MELMLSLQLLDAPVGPDLERRVEREERQMNGLARSVGPLNRLFRTRYDLERCFNSPTSGESWRHRSSVESWQYAALQVRLGNCAQNLQTLATLRQ
jgi:hypothetical protein